MASKIQILVMIHCPSEEGAARALEAISRPITGLILEGDYMATITRGEDLTDE